MEVAKKFHLASFYKLVIKFAVISWFLAKKEPLFMLINYTGAFLLWIVDVRRDDLPFCVLPRIAPALYNTRRRVYVILFENKPRRFLWSYSMRRRKTETKQTTGARTTLDIFLSPTPTAIWKARREKKEARESGVAFFLLKNATPFRATRVVFSLFRVFIGRTRRVFERRWKQWAANFSFLSIERTAFVKWWWRKIP